MTVPVSSLVVLAMLRSLSPESDARLSPIADAMASAANADPLTNEDDGAARAVTVLGSVAWLETGFKTTAIGDGGRSFGLYQVMPFVWKLDPKALLDPKTASPIALSLIKRSLRECKDRPWQERLSWYAASATCAPGKVHPVVVAQSVRRMRLADKLFRQFFPEHAPAPSTEGAKDPS